MKELEVLLNQRWVLKSENKELYYQLRDAIGDIRKYASDKLGCQVTENALMVKMEKIPVKLVYIALDNAIGFEKTILKKSSLVISRGLALSMVSGIK